jgi:hypothetical protein
MRKYIFISVLAAAATLLFSANYKNIKKNRDIRTLFSYFIQPKSGGIPIPLPIEALGQGARLPTAEELEQERQFNVRQAELAGQWLESPHTHQRIKGAEQLSAYESPLSEQYLVDALRYDAVPEVRRAAAQSLSAFKHLSDPAISILLKTLSDANTGIRIATLNTLFSYGLLINTDAKKSARLLAKMREKLRSGHLTKDVRDSLQAFIKDQEPPTNAFMASPSIAQINK